jgi:hypothetical protein
MRVMAINMEDKLFDELKEHIKKNGLTLKAYITDTISKDLDSHKQKQEETPDDAVKQGKWERDDVVKALDNFMAQNNRVPTQKEFRSENGLPSYNAAQRCLEQVPSEYCRLRFEEMQEPEETAGLNEGVMMGM